MGLLCPLSSCGEAQPPCEGIWRRGFRRWVGLDEVRRMGPL